MLAADVRPPGDLRRLPGVPRGGNRDGSRDPGGVRSPALVAAVPRRRPRGALPARLVDGAPARARHDRDRGDPACRRAGGRLRRTAGGRLARGAAPRVARRARRRRARLAAVHRRAALRRARDRAQPRHVPAPVRRRSAGLGRQRAVDRGRVSAGPALDRRRPVVDRPGHGAGLRRARDRDRRRHMPGRTRGGGEAGALAADRRGVAGRVRLPARGHLRAGRVQGVDGGAPVGGLRGGAVASWPPTGRSSAARARASRARFRSRCWPSARVYSYSFPGLVWLGGALGVWAVVELRAQRPGRRRRPGHRRPAGRGADGARRAGCPRRPGPSGGGADGRLRELRDVQSGGLGAWQPLQPPLAAGGARDLALG